MSLYDSDFYTWSQDQAALVQAGKFDRLDLVNLAEESESLGLEQADKLWSACRLIAMHLLKLPHQPEMATRSWHGAIVRERHNVEHYLNKNPGLKARRQDLFAEAYLAARKEAAAETGLPLKAFPIEPPFTRAQVEDDDFMPNG